MILVGSLKSAVVGLVCCNLLTACGPQLDQSPQRVEASPRLGKADAVTLVSGASISSSHVDPSRSYLSHRYIESLAQVGALAGAMESVARRVDGIIASQPADDHISISEMERMEQPVFFATLFPEEQAAFVELWGLLEMPDQTPIQLTAPVAMDLTVTNMTEAPTALAIPDVVQIDSLPESLQLPARRLQLSFDSDGDQDTVSMDDLDEGEHDPLGRFTPYDVQLFGEIREEMRSRGTTEAEARVEVPTPGEFEHELVLGDLTLLVTQSVRLEEYRRISRSWTTSISLRHETAVSAQLPDGVSALMIDETTGEERFMEDQQRISRLPASTYLVELWQDGERFFSSRAQLPDLTSDMGQESYNQYMDHSFYTPAGDKLVRNPVSAGYHSSNVVGLDSYYQAWFSYDLTARTVDPYEVDITAVQRVSTDKIRLPAGRYELLAPNGIGTIYIDIYPEGVIYAEHDGDRRVMRLAKLDYKKKYDVHLSTVLHRIVFDPSNNELWAQRQDGTAADLDMVLTSDYRI